MALRIVWTGEAEASLDEIVKYLETEFGDATVTRFLLRVNEVLDEISEHPELFHGTETSGIRRGFVSRQTSLYYRIGDGQVELLSFWNNRKSPSGMKW